MAIIQQSLKDALADRNLAELPVESNLDAGWSEAIVLVARAVGGIQSYAYATKKDGKISVVRDYGFAYKVCRGSSYPCSTCDYECSYTHFTLDSLPPYHAHCRCYIVPIYSTGFI